MLTPVGRCVERVELDVAVVAVAAREPGIVVETLLLRVELCGGERPLLLLLLLVVFTEVGPMVQREHRLALPLRAKAVGLVVGVPLLRQMKTFCVK